jgi:GT2 family glycosyltransferase
MEELSVIVILNWNGAGYIRDCLRSAFAQTYPRYQVLVVDNGSTDVSPAIIHDEFPEATLLRLPENLHFARGSNAGIRKALEDPDCTHVVTLNNDTRVDPEWLRELVHGAGHGVAMVASKLFLMDHSRVLNSTGLCIAPDGSGMDRGWKQRDDGQYDAAFDVFGPTAGAGLYTREALQTVGLFDEAFLAYYEDLDLAWRIRLAGWEARFAPRAIVHHKFSASYGSGNPMRVYLCERNRIWNFVQNYPWRYAGMAIPWNFARNIAGPLPWDHAAPVRRTGGNPKVGTVAKAMARARIDGYAGIPRALANRRRRAVQTRVDPGTVGTWLRRYGVGLRESVLA